jgi:hypothetical protein
MGSSAFLAGFGGEHGLDGLGHQVLELKGLNEVGVPE